MKIFHKIIRKVMERNNSKIKLGSATLSLSGQSVKHLQRSQTALDNIPTSKLVLKNTPLNLGLQPTMISRNKRAREIYTGTMYGDRSVTPTGSVSGRSFQILGRNKPITHSLTNLPNTPNNAVTLIGRSDSSITPEKVNVSVGAHPTDKHYKISLAEVVSFNNQRFNGEKGRTEMDYRPDKCEA